MMIVRAYPETAKVCLGSVPLGGVVSAEESESWSEHPVLGFGDSEPSAYLTFDRRYGVLLRRDVTTGDGVSFEGIGEFTLTVGNTVYGGCRCLEIKTTKKSDGSVTQSVKIRALTRQEVENDE